LHLSIRTGLSIAALAGAAILCPNASPLGVATAHAEDESVDDCVGFELAEADQGLAYELANSCATRLTCQMSWNVVCGDDRKGPPHPGAKRFGVARNASANVTTSTAACGSESWVVQDVTWACNPG
jgi:hypothetical protein